MSFEIMAWAVKQDLPATQKIVLLMLADRVNKDTGQCNPSMTRLAKDSGIDERTARRVVRQLEKLGLIASIRRSSEGVSLPNSYQFILSGVGAQSPHGGGTKSGRGGGTKSDKPVISKPVIKPYGNNVFERLTDKSWAVGLVDELE